MAKKTISISVEEKLKALYDLQCVDSEIDQLRIVRGELPVEIQDLEDEIARLEARLEKFEEEKAVFYEYADIFGQENYDTHKGYFSQ